MLGAHCKESRTRDQEAKMAGGAAEVREAKGLVTLVEKAGPAIGADVDSEGKVRILARALPHCLCSYLSPRAATRHSLIISLGPQACPLLLHP